MESLINDALRAALTEQIGAERYNAQLYLYISAWLNNLGLDNLAKFFMKQHDEEIGHSLIIVKLMTDLNSRVDIPEINGCSINFSNIQDIAKTFLDAEINTTNSLSEIRELADGEKCSIVRNRMDDMIELQQSEMEESYGFSDRANVLSEWWQVALWDASLNGD